MRDLGLGGLARSRGRVVTKPQGVFCRNHWHARARPCTCLVSRVRRGLVVELDAAGFYRGLSRFIEFYRVLSAGFIGLCRVLSGFGGWWALVSFGGL